jgi:hypothetical protein
METSPEYVQIYDSQRSTSITNSYSLSSPSYQRRRSASLRAFGGCSLSWKGSMDRVQALIAVIITSTSGLSGQ